MSQLMLFDDLKIGDRWVSPAKPVTRQDAEKFAALTLDFNPLHLDDTFASESPFGQPIAHGLLGLSLVAGLVSHSPHVETIALLGIYDWQFVRPIYYGDRVHVVSDVHELEPAGRKRGRVMWSRQLVNQSGYTVQQGRFDTLVSRIAPIANEATNKRGMETLVAATTQTVETPQ